MGRLTYWNEEYGCWSYRCSSGDAAKHLAAYEDIGLEPEDFKKVFNEDAILKLAAQVLDTTPIHLRELVQAEKDGRLVVLPCKFGSEVYVIENVGDWHDIPCGHESECEVCSTDCRLYNQKHVVEKVITVITPASLVRQEQQSGCCKFCNTAHEDWSDGGAWEGVQIKFCPMCGRELDAKE